MAMCRVRGSKREAVQKAKVVQPSVTSVEPKGRRRDVCGKTWELSVSQRARLFNGALYTKDLREVGFFNACLLNAMVHFQRYKKDHIREGVNNKKRFLSGIARIT